MKMDPAFLRDVQRHGWVVEAVDGDSCLVRCPSAGCGMRARLRASTTVPARAQPRYELDHPVGSFDDARPLLRARRQELLLSISEVEEAAGLATDHIAKCERPEYSKVPNMDTLALWAEAIGFEIVLRPKPLPAMTLRMISDTRDKAASRRRRVVMDRKMQRRRGAS